MILQITISDALLQLSISDLCTYDKDLSEQESTGNLTPEDDIYYCSICDSDSELPEIDNNEAKMIYLIAGYVIIIIIINTYISNKIICNKN